MTPVYFPFTHLSPRAAAALQAHFEAIALLRPFGGPLPPGMQALERRGFLKVWTPVGDDEEAPAAVLRRLQEWGQRHAGGAGPATAFWHERVTGGEPSAFELAARIKRRPTSANGASQAERLRAARVFLLLAQELDREEEELLQRLASHDQQNARLLEGLMGRAEPGPSPRESAGASPHETHRLADRLAAWARLFAERECPRPVLVTTAAAVVEHLLETGVGARRLPAAAGHGPAGALIPELAQWAAAPAERIATLPPADGGSGVEPNRGGPIAFVFSGQTPRRFLHRLAGGEQGEGAVLPGTSPAAHTLVVLVPSEPVVT